MKPQIAALILVSFLITSVIGPLPLAMADDFRLPVPGVMVHLSPPLDPPILKGIKVHPDNPFRFDFILDKGDSELGNDQLKMESSKLIKYFLASLTIPEKDLWVNLSPYEKDRIIPRSFGLTEMGRDLLAEDYMLKQITASLIYPEDEVGKKFWKRIYEEAAKRFGTTNIPVNTFNKVWIVPQKAVVYENAKAETAYVVESKLKVMLEQDYLSLERHAGIQSEQTQNKDTNQLGSQVVREIVIPELTREVNEDKNFAKLRQVYNSLILAAWYKKKIKESILAQVYADKNKVSGVRYNSTVISAKAGIRFKNDVEGIYRQYLKAFKKGVYNYIKEDIDPVTQVAIPRKYFSGGLDLAMNATNLGSAKLNITENPAVLRDAAENNSDDFVVKARFDKAMGLPLIHRFGLQRIRQGIENRRIRRRMEPEFIKLEGLLKNETIPAEGEILSTVQTLSQDLLYAQKAAELLTGFIKQDNRNGPSLNIAQRDDVVTALGQLGSVTPEVISSLKSLIIKTRPGPRRLGQSQGHNDEQFVHEDRVATQALLDIGPSVVPFFVDDLKNPNAQVRSKVLEIIEAKQMGQGEDQLTRYRYIKYFEDLKRGFMNKQSYSFFEQYPDWTEILPYFVIIVFTASQGSRQPDGSPTQDLVYHILLKHLSSLPEETFKDRIFALKQRRIEKSAYKGFGVNTDTSKVRSGMAVYDRWKGIEFDSNGESTLSLFDYFVRTIEWHSSDKGYYAQSKFAAEIPRLHLDLPDIPYSPELEALIGGVLDWNAEVGIPPIEQNILPNVVPFPVRIQPPRRGTPQTLVNLSDESIPAVASYLRKKENRWKIDLVLAVVPPRSRARLESVDNFVQTLPQKDREAFLENVFDHMNYKNADNDQEVYDIISKISLLQQYGRSWQDVIEEASRQKPLLKVFYNELFNDSGGHPSWQSNFQEFIRLGVLINRITPNEQEVSKPGSLGMLIQFPTGKVTRDTAMTVDRAMPAHTRQANIENAVDLLSGLLTTAPLARHHVEDLLFLWGNKHGFQESYSYLKSPFNLLGDIPPETDIDDLLAEIPAGSTFLGSGLSALVFKTPENEVLRIQKYGKPRPKLEGLLQPLDPPKEIGEYQIEKLPLASPLSGFQDLKVIVNEINAKLKAQGYRLKAQEVIDSNNFGIFEGKFVVLDPGAIERDRAMRAPGGIDLTADRMNLTIHGNGNIKFHIDPAMLKQLQNAPGFVPVIISIEPMKSLQMFLGVPSE